MKWPRNQEHTPVSSVMLSPNWADDPNSVYVGMPCRYTRAQGMTNQQVGPFGKPWACLNDKRGWRVAYLEYLVNRLQADPDFRAAVKALHGKTLICFCKGSQRRGSDPDCHADALALAAERLFHSDT